MLAIYNTLTRKKEVFKPLADQVRWYSCGPTVYDFAHIGNLRMYIVEDVLGRWLKESNYKVFHVMNITDVDDKTIAGAKKMDVSLWEYTDYYFHAFLDDLKSLNILAPNLFTKATDHIQDMINLIKILLAKGFAYKGEDGSVYFSIEKSKNYGELAQLDKNQSQSAVRVAHDEYSKENSTDFALWKAESEADSGVAWDAPFGKGRPGWHIECSAMSMKYLGEHFDLHDGGVDLIFPHHSNEIAQSEGVSGKKFVNFWFHAEHLMVDGQKMSKSLGNFYTLKDLIIKKYNPLSFRLFILGAHYKTKLNFTWQALDGAIATLIRLYDFTNRMKQFEHGYEINFELTNKIEKAKKDFAKALDDDLNTAQALAVLFNLMQETNIIIEKQAASTTFLLEALYSFDKVLGLRIKEGSADVLVPLEILKLIDQREKLRAIAKFNEADELRKQIEESGYIIKDTPMGSRVTKK